ncbi:MAG: ATP-binding cassette domain-containing protein [Actinomycetota bacterium]
MTTTAGAPALELREVDKSFGVKVVNEVSFSVDRGQAVGIVGPNGAGKTTLFNLIAGDLSPDTGTIHIDGTDVTRHSPRRRCRGGVGRTSQIPRPFEGMTVFENVLVAGTYGSSDQRSEAAAVDVVHDSLRRAAMLDLANQPAGSLTLLQRKRLELARALATEPSLLLLDEIAGGLTDAEVRDLVETIAAVSADGVTIVWIEHIVHALMAVVDTIVAISAGTKIAEGNPDAVMNSTEVQEVYLGVVEVAS